MTEPLRPPPESSEAVTSPPPGFETYVVRRDGALFVRNWISDDFMIRDRLERALVVSTVWRPTGEDECLEQYVNVDLLMAALADLGWRYRDTVDED